MLFSTSQEVMVWDRSCNTFNVAHFPENWSRRQQFLFFIYLFYAFHELVTKKLLSARRTRRAGIQNAAHLYTWQYGNWFESQNDRQIKRDFLSSNLWFMKLNLNRNCHECINAEYFTFSMLSKFSKIFVQCPKRRKDLFIPLSKLVEFL